MDVFEKGRHLDKSDWAKPTYTKIEEVWKKRVEFGSSGGSYLGRKKLGDV